MNKLSRERVKNNFKWIYVQPASLRPKIDGLGTVINASSLPPPPSIKESRLSRSQEKRGIPFFSGGHHTACAWSLHLSDRRGPLVSVWPGAKRLESEAARKCVSAGSAQRSLARSSQFCNAQMCVQWKSTLGMLSSPLPHRPTAWSMVAAAANSFSEEARRKPRKYCPHHLPDSTTTSIEFSENRKGRKATVCS